MLRDARIAVPPPPTFAAHLPMIHPATVDPGRGRTEPEF
jgi:hypothetical protein